MTESFSPKAMRAWGLGYDALREVNPRHRHDVELPVRPDRPALSQFAGYGTMAAAMSGFFGVTGLARPCARAARSARTPTTSRPGSARRRLLAALDHRRRTGEGQYIDFAQAEGALHALAPALLDYTVNGHVWRRARQRRSGRSTRTACSRRRATTSWVALAVHRRRETRRAGRRRRRARRLRRSASGRRSAPTRTPPRACRRSVCRPTPCRTAWRLAADPQLVHRRHFRHAAAPVARRDHHRGPALRAVAHAGVECRGPGPDDGPAHLRVLTEVLGYDEDRFTDLLISGAIE